MLSSLMRYRRLPIEIESPEQLGYGTIRRNLTESSYSDATLGNLSKGLDKLVLCYGDHLGSPRLRALIAREGKGLTPADVLVAPGAAAALFIVATALLEQGDEMLVVKPNYATNIETPRALGCKVKFLDLRFKNGWRLDPAEVEKRLTRKTKLVSLTTPHNPTGVALSERDLRRIVKAVEKVGARLLIDETYRDMAFAAPPPVASTLSKNVISVSSLSKTYGLPGIRVGWLTCRDRKLMETFLAAKEQIVICGSILDEEIAARALEARAKTLPKVKADIAARWNIVKAWLAREPRLECVEPEGGVVCFPRIKASAKVNVARFYRVLNEKHGTYVGPGHWFEESRRSFRLGYGWPTHRELREGLAAISAALSAAARR